MQSQQALAAEFAAGHDPSSIEDASNLEVWATDTDGYDAILVGYGHAVYAARRSDGSVVRFDGWRGYSQSTTCQLTELRKGFKSLPERLQTVVGEGRPKLYNYPDADPFPLATA